MEWNRETILHFISLIKQRPAIWDSQSSDFKIKRKRHAAIEEVALLMGVTPKEVNTKWIILRNQYSREKRRNLDTDNGTPYVTKWYAFKEMDALMTNKHPMWKFWTQERHSEDEASPPSPPPAPPRPSASGRQPAQPTDTVTQNSSTMYTQAVKTLKSIREHRSDTINDELTNYGLYIAAHIRKFSPPFQSRAKYEISKILYALDMETMGECSASINNDVEGNDDLPFATECKFDPLQSQNE